MFDIVDEFPGNWRTVAQAASFKNQKMLVPNQVQFAAVFRMVSDMADEHTYLTFDVSNEVTVPGKSLTTDVWRKGQAISVNLREPISNPVQRVTLNP